MIFRRKIYSKLLEWKNTRHGQTALLIEGARRVGKSTIVEEFAKNEYKSYVLIDFLLSNGSKTNFKTNPIEVRSSKNYSTTSLLDFKDRFKKRIAEPFVIHPKNLKQDKGITYIPIYMTFLM